MLASVAWSAATVGCRESKRKGLTSPVTSTPSTSPGSVPRHDRLEPDPSIFDEDPYYELVRDSLLAGHSERECEMTGLPSYGGEFAVFVACTDASLSVVLRTAPVGLIYFDDEKHAADRGRTLEHIKKVTREYTAPISLETVDLSP